MKNILPLFYLLLFTSSTLFAQDFYDIPTLREMHLSFKNTDYHERMVAEWFANTGERELASVEMDGVTYDSVGIRYKGNSTFFIPNDLGSQKLPLNLDMNDFIKGQDLLGFTSIKLATDFFDPSMIREVLGYSIYNKYMPSPRANFLQVYVDDSFLGVYANTESINKSFVKSRFGNNKGALFKCEPAGQFGQGNMGSPPDLNWLGSDSTAYLTAYELKSKNGWKELLNLIDILNNRPEELESVLNIDRVLWNFAVSAAIANYDTYNGVFIHNYYLYLNKNGLFQMIPWDVSESFVGALYQEQLFEDGNIYELDPFVRKDSIYGRRALLHYIDKHPVYRKQYLAHIRTVLEEISADDFIATRSEELQDIISLAMLTDKNALFGFSFLFFKPNLTETTTLRELKVPGLIPAAQQRKEFLLAHPEINQTTPIIQNVQQSSDSPLVGETIYITASIENETEIDLMVTKNKYASHFQSIPMLDDGQHGEGAANDGIFGAAIPYTEFEDKVKYYIRAQNEGAMSLMPKKAEFEFFKYTVTSEMVTEESEVVINEFMASNDNTASDQDGEFDDWIELYNKSNTDIDLTGYFLTDDTEKLDEFEFPAETIIPAEGYLIIWADKDDMQEGLHASFKLSASGEEILLVNADTMIIDRIVFEEQTTDRSSARKPNGTGNFVIGSPTFNANNETPTRLNEVNFEHPALHIFPNPARSKLAIELMDKQLKTMDLQLFDIYGRLVMTKSVGTNKTNIFVNQLPTGMYYLVVNEVFGRKIVIE